MPQAHHGVPYSYNFAATVSGGTPPYFYSVTTNDFPLGLSFNTSTGIISGTIPCNGGANGTYKPVILITDSSAPASQTLSQQISINLTGSAGSCATLALASTNSSSTQVGVSYSQTNVGSGGSSPYTYSIFSGSLPAGTSISSSTGTVSGTPTTAGAFNYTVQVADSTGATVTNTVSGTMAPAPLALTSTSSTITEVNATYSQTNIASGGMTPYTYSISAGSLPVGVILNSSTGTVSGTPTTIGAFSYTVQVTDGASSTVTRAVSGTIFSALILTSTASSIQEVNGLYSQTNVGSGGVSPYSYAISSGALPTGVTLNTSTGLASGTAAASGSYSYTIRITDAQTATATQTITGTIAAALSLSSTPSSIKEVGASYSQTNVASGGSTPYVYSVSAGSLPSGVTLNTSTGTVSGTPSTSGSFSYTIRVTDNAGLSTTQTISGTIATALTLSSTPSTIKEVGGAYSQTNVASGGATPYTYSISSGSLPSGVTLNSSTGTVSGTATTAGAFSYTIQATDAQTVSATQTISGTIAEALFLTSTSSSVKEVGASYSQTNIGSGGSTPYTYSVSAGSLPSGLTLNSSTGTVSGTPTTSGAFSYTIRVTDNASLSASQIVSGTIASLLSLTSTSSTMTEVSSSYVQTNVGSGGSSPYTYAISSGSLPLGVSLNTSTGTASGTASSTGVFNYAVQVTDAQGVSATQTITGTIASALLLTPTPSAIQEAGATYLQTNVGSGGFSPYTYSIEGGSLPSGVTLNTSTGTVSGTPTSAGTYSYIVQVTDAQTATASQVVTGTLLNMLTLTSTPSSALEVNGFYSQTNSASGGESPYVYSISSGTLPVGASFNSSTGSVSGMLTTEGSFSYTIQAVDAQGVTTSQLISGSIASALDLVSTSSSITEVGAFYSQANTASGGSPPYRYSLASGSFPNGLALNPSTGVVSGTPTTAESFSYTIRVTDAIGLSATQTVSGTMSSLLILTSTPSSVKEIGGTYSQTNIGSGGFSPYSYAISSGALPSGLALNTLTGTISGTPTTAGSFNYTVQLTDSQGVTATQTITGSIADALSLTSTPSSLQEVGAAYVQTNVAFNGSSPYTYSRVAGALPNGVSLNTSTGTVSGTPTLAQTFSYTIQVTDAGNITASQVITGIIESALILASTSSSTQQVGVAYLQTNVASGGQSPYSYAVSAGSLPPGLSLNSSTGTVSGTPTREGSYSYTIQVTDDEMITTSQVISGSLAPPLSLASTSSSFQEVGASYLQTNNASGGSTPYTYSVIVGELPNGVTLNSLTGIVSGTPSMAGTYNYTIQVTDGAGATVNQSVSGSILTALVLTSTPSTFSAMGASYFQTNAASGGASPYTYAISAGSLPTAVTLNTSTGTVSGTPTIGGSYSYTVRVVDAQGVMATRTITGEIASSLVLLSEDAPVQEEGINYSQTNVASGGQAPYSYSQPSGTLPPGVILDTATGTVSGIPSASGTYTYTIEVDDAAGLTSQQMITAIIADQLKLVSNGAPVQEVGATYNQTNEAQGGISPYTYAISSGALPDGVTLNTSTGTVTGTPTTSGSFNYTIEITDDVGARANQTIGGIIADQLVLASVDASLQEVGFSYVQTNTGSGGVSPYTYSLALGSLPSGVSLNTTTGTVSGTPTTIGTYNYTIAVTDSAGVSATQLISAEIISGLSLTSTPSTNLEVGQSYSQANTASGGAAPYSFSVISGSLPDGVSLNSSTGTVSGTPTTVGSFSYTIQVTDFAGATATQTMSDLIATSLNLISSSSSVQEVGGFYSQSNIGLGGQSPYTFDVSSGSLPSGVALDSSSGLASGTPDKAGPFSYTICVTDASGATAMQSLSGNIAAALSLTLTNSTFNEVGAPYVQRNDVSGGVSPYSFVTSSGSLPTGTSLNAATGVVSGTPTASGSFTYDIQIRDAQGGTASQTVIVSIARELILTSDSSSVQEVGAFYSQSNTASGGTAPYLYAVSDGFLPAGVSLDTSTGLVTGTLAVAEDYFYTVAVTDGQGVTTTQIISGTILGRLSLSSSPSLILEKGAPYSQTNAASGGEGPYTYSLSGGALPNGLTLDSSTGTVSGTPTASGPFSYTIQVTDAQGISATQIVSGTLAPLLVLTCTPAIIVEQGVSYSQINIASGGTSPYTYSLSGGALPNGTSLNSTSGTVSGTPLTSGPFSYQIRVTDRQGVFVTQTVSGVLADELVLNSVDSSFQEVGVSYFQSNSASGGSSPYTYIISAGALPDGVVLGSDGTVQGTPTTAGSYLYAIEVTDSQGVSTEQSVSGIILDQLQLFSTESSVCEVGASYSQTNVATGGAGPYTYSVSSGFLPSGVTLNTSSGLISGTPTTVGSFSYEIQVIDGQGVITTNFISAMILNQLILTSTASLIQEIHGSYLQTNTASGGAAPYTYSVSSGSLPDGTTLNPSTGTVSGSPTTGGPYSYTIQVTDDQGVSSLQNMTGAIISELMLVSFPASITQVGTFYSQDNIASGGSTPYTYSLSSGALPSGLTLDPSTGIVSGIPEETGAFSYTIQVSDAQGVSTAQNLTGTIFSPIILDSTPSSLNGVGTIYSQTNSASGGTGSYVYSLAAGALPAGTSLDNSTGTVSGTLTMAQAFSYTIQVTDGQGATATEILTGAIIGEISLSSTPSLLTEVGVLYSQSNVAAGGVTPYTYSIASGVIPAGAFLNTTTGLISGTLTSLAEGPFSYVVQVTDAEGISATQIISGSVAEELVLTFTPSAIQEAGSSYSQTNSASGGISPYTYSLLAGSIPAGLSLDTTSGTVSGIPTGSGLFSYTIQVVDFAGVSTSQTISGSIAASLTLLSTASSIREVGAPYSQANMTQGGTAPFSYSLLSGELPAGTTLSTSTGTVSGIPTLAGTFLYTIAGVDAAGQSAQQSVSGEILSMLTLVSSGSSIQEVGSFYSQSNQGGGGALPYSYSVISGNLPSGLSLDSTTGTVSGVPTAMGSYSYTIQVTDAQSVTDSQNITGSIGSELILISTDSSVQEVNAPFNQTNSVRGGSSPYSYQIIAGSLPDGLTFNSSTGTVSGTPTTAQTYTYTIQVIDGEGVSSSQVISGTIASELVLTFTSSSLNQMGGFYEQVNTASGGMTPYLYSIIGGSLPSGLTLDPSTGIISGIPLSADPFSYTVQVVDAHGVTRSIEITGSIAIALVLTSTESANQGIGLPYLQTNVASGGVAPYTFLVASGELPLGVSLDTSTGIVSGTPTQIGIYSYSIQVVDSQGGSVTNTLSGDITDELFVISSSSSVTKTGEFYSQTNTASGGISPYVYSVYTEPSSNEYIKLDSSNLSSANFASEEFASVKPPSAQIISGSLPPGLTLDPNTGVVSGIPTQSGIFTYTILATDSTGATATTTVTVTIEIGTDPTKLPNVRALIQAQVATALQFSTTQITNVMQHLEILHNRLDLCNLNIDFTFKDECEKRGNIPVKLLKSNDACDSKSPSCKYFGLWATGTVDFGTLHFGKKSAKSRFLTNGVTAGLDRLFSPYFLMGGAFGVGKNENKIKNAYAKSEAQGYFGMLYTSVRPITHFFIDGLVGYGNLNFENERLMPNELLASKDRDGSSWFGSLSLNGVFKYQNWQPSFFLRGNFLWSELAKYKEKGEGDLLLTYQKMNTKTTDFTFGMRHYYDIVMRWGTLTSFLRFDYSYSFDSGYTQKMFYSNLPEPVYHLNIQNILKNLFSGAVGLRAAIKSSTTIDIEYGGYGTTTGIFEGQSGRFSIHVLF